jgi:hypothetical protein
MRINPLKFVRMAVVATILCAIVLPAAVMAQAEDDDFVPRSGAPPASRTGGASRGASAAASAANVTLLAPADTIGLTTREQPVIHWYLSADTDKPIEIAINDPKKLDEPVLEATFKGPHKAGLHKLDLSSLKQDDKPVKLSPNVKYDMVVEVVTSGTGNGASANPNATCKIMRLDPKDTPADAATEKDKAKLASVYGKQGIWFDYIDALNAAIAENPKDESLAERRTKALAAQRITWTPDGKIVETRGVRGKAR